MYNENYVKIDSSMSCSNIGARKDRNIRDHLFVINAIMHEVSENKSKNVDIQIFDIKKCFDKMWASETANDMYNAGLNDENFVLVANSNKQCQVAVKTPWGSFTKRENLSDIEMQGGVLTPLKCSVQIDTLGKETLASSECSKSMYKYKDCVKIPAMSFVDDVLSITECGPNSIKMNAYVQSKVDTKKLELSDTKCVKMHIGTNSTLCPTLKTHSKEMPLSFKEKYLGDILTSDTKIDENIKLRHDKGIGIVNQILSMLKDVSFGVYHFEMGLLFRTSLLLNGILFNTEALFSLNDSHILSLEECDKYFMRQLFNVEATAPIESLYIETSTVPLRFILRGRRLMYYWTILHKSESELVKRVFLALKEFPSKRRDWMADVREDIAYFELNVTEEEILKMKKKFKFRKLISQKIKSKAREYLTELQMKHRKSQFLYQESTMKGYLMTEELTTREKQLLFKLRSRVTPNKTNYRKKYEHDLSCTLCRDPNTEESESHLLSCPFLVNKPQLGSVMQTVQYEDIYKNLTLQVKAVKVWTKIFKIYDKVNSS